MNALHVSDLRFLQAFESCELTAAEFRHREHLRLAYIYLSLYPFDRAAQKMEEGLRRLLAHLGAPPSKYHETLTWAWLLAVHHFMHLAGPTTGFDEFLAGSERLLDQHVMSTHYTPERLSSKEARSRFLEPDRQPIPQHPAPASAALSHLSPKTIVKQSPIHGRGLFAATAIAKDEIVAVKGGHIISGKTLATLRPRLGPAEIQIGDDLFICPISEEEREGSMIFSNHSCDPNIGLRGQIVFVAMRNIEPGEELTHDWAITDDNDDSATICRCGSANCRGTITGKDWQRLDLQERYRDYFSAYLLAKMRAPSE